MNSPLSIAAGAILAVSLTAAQGIPGGTPPLRLNADLSIYAGGDSTRFVEISYGLSEASLTYWRDSTGFSGAADMKLEVRTGGRTVASREWSIPRTVPESLANLAAKNILSLETVMLPYGEYTVVLFCRDRGDSTRSDSVALPVHAEALKEGAVGLSDIELCSGITPSTSRTSLFYKNTLEVIPNPGRLYGEGLPVLHFYAEVYNLAKTGGGDVVVRAAIVDPAGNVVTSSSKTKPRVNNSSVEYGSMNLSTLQGGSYVFRLSVLDSASDPPRLLAVSEKKFFILRPAPPDVHGGGNSVTALDEFSSLTSDAVEDEIRKVMYIASEPERDQIENLPDSVARLNFLRTFWQGRDPDARTARNEAREEYLRRVKQADDAYTERGREGWLTDRGRVLILYGPPNDIERHPSEPETHPYEIWSYHDLQGGVEFVFVDELGFGRYRLVHSTHLNELRNDNWYSDEAKIR